MLRSAGLLVMILILVAGSAHAGVTPGSSLLSVYVSYAAAKTAGTGDDIDGGLIWLDYQKLDWGSKWSGGVSAGYGQVQHTLTGQDSTETNSTVSSVPIYLGGKYWLGSGDGLFQGYVGAAFGMYFSSLETTVNSTVGVQDQDVSGGFSTETTLGFGMGVPVGVMLSLGDTFLLTANYTLNWLWSNEFLDSDIMHTAGLGIAFKFGG